MHFKPSKIEPLYSKPIEAKPIQVKPRQGERSDAEPKQAMPNQGRAIQASLAREDKRLQTITLRTLDENISACNTHTPTLREHNPLYHSSGGVVSGREEARSEWIEHLHMCQSCKQKLGTHRCQVSLLVVRPANSGSCAVSYGLRYWMVKQLATPSHACTCVGSRLFILRLKETILLRPELIHLCRLSRCLL